MNPWLDYIARVPITDDPDHNGMYTLDHVQLILARAAARAAMLGMDWDSAPSINKIDKLWNAKYGG